MPTFIKTTGIPKALSAMCVWERELERQDTGKLGNGMPARGDALDTHCCTSAVRAQWAVGSVVQQTVRAVRCGLVRTRDHGPFNVSFAVQWPSCVVASHQSSGHFAYGMLFGSSLIKAWYVPSTFT